VYVDILRQLQLLQRPQPPPPAAPASHPLHPHPLLHPGTAPAASAAGASGAPVWTAEWVNAAGESFLPYDIVVRRGGEVVSYIEVKASTSLTKSLFEIGATQLVKAAQELGSRWELALVRGARGPTPVILRVPNALAALRQRRLQLFVGLSVGGVNG
jgi:hypothetical protein